MPVTLPCVVEKTDLQVLDEADEKVYWRLKILNRNVDMFIDKVGKTISENGGNTSLSCESLHQMTFSNLRLL